MEGDRMQMDADPYRLCKAACMDIKSVDFDDKTVKYDLLRDIHLYFVDRAHKEYILL